MQFPQVCRVEASAGSGKTYALAQRYVQLLINPALNKTQEVPLRHILAITFSNKAASEMKERILDLLKRMALDKLEDPARKRETLSLFEIDEDVAREGAYRIMEEIIRHYNFFQVQTIDSFINAILCGCAFKLNLSANFRIKTNYSEYLSYSLDKVIDQAAVDPKIRRKLRDFLAQYLYMENRTGWFPKSDILAAVADLFFRVNRYAGTFRRSRVTARETVAKKKKILDIMRRLSNDLPPDTNKVFCRSLADFLRRNRTGFDMDDLSDFFRREEFPAAKNQDVPASVRRRWSRLREGFRDAAEAEAAGAFNPYIDIFKNVMEYFKNLSHKDDILFLDELNRRTTAIFDEKAVGIPELYYRLAMRLRHILIDEFQDTSRLQWDNLYPMVEEALATGGSLFYVGDKKQAIYRFRGGEASLFDAVKDRFAGYNLILRSLSRNYRSHKEIVLFVNSVFSKKNLSDFLATEEGLGSFETESVLKVFEGAAQTFTASRDRGYVGIELIDSKNREERDALTRGKILGLVEELGRRFGYSQIALLTRQNDDVELLSEWLIEKGLPVESEKTLNIRNNARIKEVVSFLKFLHSPIDNLSFVSFILGEIFIRAAGLDKERLHDFIFGLRGKTRQEKNVYFYREFRRNFSGPWEVLIETFFKNVGFLPLYELTVGIFDRFRCLENFPDEQGFFMKFLDLVKEQEKEEKHSLPLFLDYFENAAGEDLYVQVSKADAIRVLTIHKSKGLGFAAVILPFLEMDVKVEPIVTEKEGGHLTLKRLREKHRNFSPALNDIYRREFLKSFIDELNSIYVAMTRAEEELYIFLPKNARRGPNRARLLVPADRPQMGLKRQEKKGASPRAGSPSVEIPAPHYEDWARFLADEFEDAGHLQRREKIVRGEILHHMLSFIGDLSGQDKDAALRQSLEKTRLKFPFSEDLKEPETCVRKALADEKFRPFFFAPGAQVFQEKEVVDRFGNTRRLDRLIVTEQEAWVIDYKSTREASDTEQVKQYVSLMAEVYPRKKVRGFLLYLDTLDADEVS